MLLAGSDVNTKKYIKSDKHCEFSCDKYHGLIGNHGMLIFEWSQHRRTCSSIYYFL